MATDARNKSNKGMWGWIAAIGIFLLAKMKWVFALFKIGKFATLASMFVSLGGYAIIFGWKFAFAIVYLIFVHEMGHLAAAKIKKIPTSPAIFIPFMGAAIGIDPKKIKDAETEFFVAYGGPLAGLVSILPAAGLYTLTQDPYWGLVIQLGGLINLFNLFPVSPLDGGRIVTVLSTKIWFIGLLVMIPIIFISPDPIIILIFIFGIFTWWDRFKDNAKVEIMKHEEKVLTEVNDELKHLVAFTPHSEEMNTSNFISIKNKINYRLNEISKHLSADSGSVLPVIQEKKRTAFKKRKAEKDILTNMLNQIRNYELSFYENTPINTDLNSVIIENEKKLTTIRAEMDRAKTYYQTSIGTKIRALILYLGLAVVLALFLVYGMEILESSQITR
ncbi:site-2 protease family protein [Virgibacillus siamensis]|uniref:site-2 protease family protein n=1 Tax=Virgibacillus siamensis TaxID=480071 RepID=UPI00098451D8|nr:site-2 protease family protein [Virgibacillus siamensis]